MLHSFSGTVGSVTETCLDGNIKESLRDGGYAANHIYLENKPSQPAPFVRQDTWTCEKPSRELTPAPGHQRIVYGAPWKRFKEFTGSRHMLQVVSDAFTGHREAYERCGFLHGDISSHNISITSTERGVLNDWDQAKWQTVILSPRQHPRMGTWRFMSCHLLNEHHTAFTLQDDLESFVLVVLSHALRYFGHNLRREHTHTILHSVFVYYLGYPPDYVSLGDDREELFLRSRYIGYHFCLSSVPLQRWLKAGIAIVKQWIKTELCEPCSISGKSGQGMRFLDSHARMTSMFTYYLASSKWPQDDVPRDVMGRVPRYNSDGSSSEGLLEN
ncbi:hypothetical protein DXG01_014056 [Tephrocybe rancida]|nr:hypothetical protein DXG01_014056 [Tephrocybe rancida]